MSEKVNSRVAPIDALLTELIDYAGLFPPAALAMEPAVRLDTEYRQGSTSWMLGKFICPVARFEEFEHAAVKHPTNDRPVSALIGENLDADLDAIAALIERQGRRVRVPTIEMKAAKVGLIDEAIEFLPDGLTCFFEFPVGDRIDSRGFVTALAGTGHGAKIRTGGLEAKAFPSPEAVAKFIIACRDAEVPFKATAGMHHPIRRHDASLGCRMHGFVNVFGAAAACLAHDLDVAAVRRIIECEDATAFEFAAKAMRVLDWTVDAAEIANARKWALSYGSCSFDEPVDDLRALGWL